MQALELMKTHVVKTMPDATLSEAVDLMDLYQTTGLPVVDASGCLCGILTERDVMRALFPEGESGEIDAGAQARQAVQWRVEDFMTQPAISVQESVDVREAFRTMRARGLKRLPVLSAEGQVIGMLNRIDICQAILEGSW